MGYQHPLFPWSGEPSSVPAVDDWIRHSEKVWDSTHLQRVPGQQTTSLTPSLPTWKESLALHKGHQAVATEQEAKSQVFWPIQDYQTD